MTDVSITLKVSAYEFQTLRAELQAAKATLLAASEAAKVERNFNEGRNLLERAAQVNDILEKLG